EQRTRLRRRASHRWRRRTARACGQSASPSTTGAGLSVGHSWPLAWRNLTAGACFAARAVRIRARRQELSAPSGTECEICDLAPDAVQPVLVQAEMHHREGRLEIGEHLLGRTEGLLLDPVGDRDVRVIGELQL